jgi:hypothetical protein
MATGRRLLRCHCEAEQVLFKANAGFLGNAVGIRMQRGYVRLNFPAYLVGVIIIMQRWQRRPMLAIFHFSHPQRNQVPKHLRRQNLAVTVS